MPAKPRSAAGRPRLGPDDWLVHVWGRPKTGKSTWLREALRGERSVVAWDPTDGLGGAGKWAFEGRARDFLRAQSRQRARLARARVWGDDDDFAGLCAYVEKAGKCVFAIDEAHVFLPTTISSNHPFKRVLVQMRHVQVRLVLVGWRPYNVAAFTRSGISRVVAFRLNDARSIDYLAKEAGATAGVAAKLPDLPEGASNKRPRYFDWRP